VPDLSVPSYRLLQRGIGWRQGRAYGTHEINAIGAWLPELEFTHYSATRRWRELMNSCDAFVAVSGNVLAATPFLQTHRNYLAWVATDWQGDRQDRVKHFPLVRRLLDTCINGPIIRRLEKRLLRQGHVLSLSDYTARMLGDIAGPSFHKTLLPVAVDSASFVPRPAARVAGRLGFAGRFNDPRKNSGLLLRAFAQLRRDGHEVSLLLMGDTADGVAPLIAELGVGRYVTIESGLTRNELRDRLQTLDVFVLPSHQEGLCIAALEAMACAVPVVSTRCGGPEEFVIDERTGTLVDTDPRAMANAIAAIVGNPALRDQMGQAARRLVEEHYCAERMQAVFAEAFRNAFPRLATERSRIREATTLSSGPATDWPLHV
jgi:glycosyltransferase involved in cell wall biosynthesis